MTISLYNSLHKTKEQFEPLAPDLVTMYSCGPTVYDHAHIGNLRAFITADTVQRVLRHIGGYDVRWVMNITDIDDKMIARAREEHPGEAPHEALELLTKKYLAAFKQDLQKVGVNLTDIATLPRATEHIEEMQAMITQLIDEGIAYIAEGSVYFSLDEYAKSGKAYGRLVHIAAEAERHARIDDQDQKVGAGDFALWKAEKSGEPAWDFDLKGENLRGRPGWHIECSAMSTKYLGHTFDIHTGGIDLKFPHHENEIAQNGGELARYWLHNEFLNVESEKMSKSLGNFLKLDAIKEPLAFRLFILSGQYRNQMDYTEDTVHAASRRRNALREWASKLMNNTQDQKSKLAADLMNRFDTSMADDLNTPEALAVIAEAERSQDFSQDMLAFAHHVDDVLGIQLFLGLRNLTLDESIMQLIENRMQVRKEKDFARSDKIRDNLHRLGVGVEDTKNGMIIWEITT